MIRDRLRFAAFVTAILGLATTGASIAPRAAPAQVETAGTRLAGLTLGPYAVGFEARRGIDPTRRINPSDVGTRVGIAIWYPADSSAGTGTAMSSLDYRLLEFLTPPTADERQMYEDGEAAALLAWRHIGIVDLTKAQATASLHARGIAVRGAPALPGRRPMVMVLGGRYYLSSTAEVLASHGFVVVAPYRFVDQSNEIGTQAFSWYLENSVRDAEWALQEMRGDSRADAGLVSAIGHGGGGLQAMLFAMRNREVAAVVNVDAGNFSSRSRARDLAFYSPRLMRAPFLYMATRATKDGQDQFEDFSAMTFADRYEVILEHADIRHHDLSDLGRAVTAPLGLRGAAQPAVQRSYTDLHDMAVRFLKEHVTAGADRQRFGDWLASRQAAGAYSVAVHRGVEPAPTVVRVLETLDGRTAGILRAARQRDPGAPVFQPDSLLRVTSKALAGRHFETAVAVADLAIELHPASPIFREQKSRALEGAGSTNAALAEASACAAMSAGNDWRASVALNACRERVARLKAS